MFCSKCGKEVNEGSKFCNYCGSELQKKTSKNQDNNLNIESNESVDKKVAVINQKTKAINFVFIIVGVYICYLIYLAFINNYASSNFSINNNSIDTSVISTFEIAVKALKNEENFGPIKSIQYYGNQIIYYGNDTLVQISYIEANLSGSDNYYTSTYSINDKKFITTIKLDNMKYDDEWKNAKIKEVEYEIIEKMNDKYFK